MHRHTTVRSPGAIALGSLCFLGTLVVLFWHVRSPSDFTVNHVYILLALAVAYGAGHFMCDAFGEWTVGGVIRGLAFSVLACIATIICVGLSGGRGAEVLHVQTEQVENEKARRVSQETRILEAKEDRRVDREVYDKAQAAADAAAAKEASECEGGDGSKCKGKGKASAAAAAKAAALYKRWEGSDAKYWIEVSRLGDFKPMQTANGNLRQLAKVYSRLSSKTEDEAMATIADLLPYALALLAEFGSIVCFQHGFGRRTVSAAVANEKTVEATISGHKTVSGNSTHRDGGQVLAVLAAAGKPVTNAELARLLGVSKGEASKRRRSVEHLVTLKRSGREVRISLNGPALH